MMSENRMRALQHTYRNELEEYWRKYKETGNERNFQSAMRCQSYIFILDKVMNEE